MLCAVQKFVVDQNYTEGIIKDKFFLNTNIGHSHRKNIYDVGIESMPFGCIFFKIFTKDVFWVCVSTVLLFEHNDTFNYIAVR